MAKIPAATPVVTLPTNADYPRVPTEYYVAQMAAIGITVSDLNNMALATRIAGLHACAAVIEAHKPTQTAVTLYKGDGPAMPTADPASPSA